ncbi:MAG: hypothetical protein ACOYUZ_02510 [Patescibacteria group bacterium]
MTEERSAKFQWISIVYLLLFALAVFSPSLVKTNYFGIDERYIEESLIFLFGITGITIFMLYERMMERQEKEHDQILKSWEKAKKELVSSYQYIGTLNRKMEIIKKLSNDTSISISDQTQLSKDLLHSLVVTASGSMAGRPALLRFVHLEKFRTESEFTHKHDNDPQTPFHVSNKELVRLHQERPSFAFLQNEEHGYVVIPSDRMNGQRKAFLIIKTDAAPEDGFDPSVLKVFANQAELIYRALKLSEQDSADAVKLVDRATEKVVGEID